MVVFDVFKMLFHAPGNELLNDGRFSCFWLGDFFLRQKWRGEGVDVVELGFYAPFHYNPRWSVLASRNIHHMNLWKLGYSPVEIEALFALMPSVALGKGTDLNLRWLSEASLDLSSALQPYQTYIEWPENRRCAEYLFEYLLNMAGIFLKCPLEGLAARGQVYLPRKMTPLHFPVASIRHCHWNFPGFEPDTNNEAACGHRYPLIFL